MALLRLLAADHPNLPAPHIGISSHYPGQLEFSIHRDLGAFEAWREALGIDPAAVRRDLQSGDTTMVLTAVAEIADAKVVLVGYARNLSLLAEVA
jgi:hypothetical protein